MKATLPPAVIFIVKSIAWSLLLYVAVMTTVNWDEISATLRGQNEITIIPSQTQTARLG